MKTPFTESQFFQVFENYNRMVFPVQLMILLLGIISVFLIASKNESKHHLIIGFLGFIWVWAGFVYHILNFVNINPAAYAFGTVFIFQGVFFFLELTGKKLEFHFTGNTREYIGFFFILFGLIIYPAISYLVEGNVYETISLGLPCPTTIFTFGFLMLSSRTFPKYLLIIPGIWALIGTAAAINFRVYQDYVMLLAAIIAFIYLLGRKKEGNVETEK